MGKSRRNRSGTAHRPDPISGGRPKNKAAKPPADPELAVLREAKILPVVRDLRSADPKTRTAAAGAIANIVEDTRCRKLLLREQVVHTVLGETLTDSNIEGRAAGWEVLSALAAYEASDFCVHLYRLDVLTPAAHALSQILETLSSTSPPFTKLTKAQQEYVWKVTSSILDLVGQLAEARDEILEAVIGNATIVRAFSALASSTVAPFEVQWTALTTLARLCDEQRALAEALVDDQTARVYPALIKLKDAGGPLAVAACALLHSVFSTLEWFDHSPGRDGASDAILVPALSAAIQEALDTASEIDHDRSMEVLSLALQTMAMIGTTLQASLEKGNRDEEVWNGIKDEDEGGDENVMAADDEEDDKDDEDDEMADGGAVETETKHFKKNGSKSKSNGDSMELDMEEEGDQDDDDDDDDLDRDMENVTGFDEEDTKESGLEDMSTLRELINVAIPQIIILIAGRSEGAGNDSDSNIFEALSALNNIAWTVACVDLQDEGNATILQAWTPAAKRIWLKAVRLLLTRGEIDLRLAATLTGLAWALAKVLRHETPVDGGEPDRFIALHKLSTGKKPEEQQAGGQSGDDADGDEKSDPFQSLPVKCIGVLGQIAQDPAPIDLNRKIGHYLVNVVEALPTTPAAEAVEALNQLFDIYGDEATTCDKGVFWQDKFLEKMEAAVPKVKAVAKTIDKRAFTELRTRADEAALNLNRFIQYKKKHVPQT